MRDDAAAGSAGHVAAPPDDPPRVGRSPDGRHPHAVAGGVRHADVDDIATPVPRGQVLVDLDSAFAPISLHLQREVTYQPKLRRLTAERVF